ncbi:hypothetical protein HPB50_011587 [Hyalomma asiaticum]|uniref:Uncharacterized protein n=1 Tax=Hyalomma asiaticum TaxID=266040 RepID=A0ACB7RUB3_HYAAI|nr:hypothetical protein HPB50_011587 [Hyalomma asiaticum]
MPSDLPDDTNAMHTDRTEVQIAAATWRIKSNTRTPDDVSRGVISGLLPGTSEELKAGLRAPAKYTVLHAPSTFDADPTGNLWNTAKLAATRDIARMSARDHCRASALNAARPDMCKPACKLCGEEHETARKDCKKRLKLDPPPFHIPQQRMDRINARDCRWSLADEEFPELGSQTTNLHSSAGGAPTRGRSLSALRPRSRSRSRSRLCSPKRVSYANVVSGSSGSETTSTSTFLSPENEV